MSQLDFIYPILYWYCEQLRLNSFDCIIEQIILEYIHKFNKLLECDFVLLRLSHYSIVNEIHCTLSIPYKGSYTLDKLADITTNVNT